MHLEHSSNDLMTLNYRRIEQRRRLWHTLHLSGLYLIKTWVLRQGYRSSPLPRRISCSKILQTVTIIRVPFEVFFTSTICLESEASLAPS